MRYTIIIPAYNSEKVIGNAIESVVRQNCADWELILIDDASTDRTGEICDAYAEKYLNIKSLHHSENCGVSVARNTGLDQASGEFILFLDSDDTFVPETLERIEEITKVEENIDIIVFGRGKWRPARLLCGRRLDREYIRSRILPRHLHLHPIDAYFLEVFVTNKCFRHALIQENHIRFDDVCRSWEDNAFLVYCLDQSNSIFVLRDTLYLDRSRSEGEHLSLQFYPELARQYVHRYSGFFNRFHTEYDFHTKKAARLNYDIFDRLMINIREQTDEKAFKDLLEEMTASTIVQGWVKGIIPIRWREWQIKRAFFQRRVDPHLYGVNLIAKKNE